MASPSVFLSFDLANNEADRGEFVRQIEGGSVACTVAYWSDNRSPDSESDKLARDKVGRCTLLIVLVDKRTAHAANVEKEIGFARQMNVPFFGVYVAASEDTIDLPAGLPGNRTIPYDWARIAAAVTQLMGEGKNHVFR